MCTHVFVADILEKVGNKKKKYIQSAISLR